MIHGHGGNVESLAQRLGCAAADIVDMSSNVNPLGPPPALTAHLAANLGRIRRLPEADAGSTVSRMARHLGRAPESVVAGNGTTELIYRLPRALTPRRVLILGPTYSDYEDACRQNGITPRFLLTGPETNFKVDLDALDRAADEADLVFICNPNNPTGVLTDPAAIDALSSRHPETCFVVDESYLPFAAPGETLSRSARPNLVVLHSLSKIFTLPGLRIGFATAHPDIISRLRRYDSPWSMNSLATAAVDFLMDNPLETELFIKDSARFLSDERRRFAQTLTTVAGIRTFPSHTSFILMALEGAHRSHALCAALGLRRILIRNCANFNGLSDRYVRVSLKSETENRRCCALLAAAVGGA
ncbi:MAG: threonine-phosphate decarboxylase CobD [Pseudomonadota bacterium]